MAGKLTHQEEVDRARVRLRLMAEKLELEAQLARSRAGRSGGLSSLVGAGSTLPPALVTAGGAALALVAGVVLARKPGLRAPVLALVARLLAR